MTTHDELLYKEYKYYGFNENVIRIEHFPKKGFISEV